jgi:hypothetical protein
MMHYSTTFMPDMHTHTNSRSSRQALRRHCINQSSYNPPRGHKGVICVSSCSVIRSCPNTFLVDKSDYARQHQPGCAVIHLHCPGVTNNSAWDPGPASHRQTLVH